MLSEPRDEFLSEEDLDLRNLTHEELLAYWNLWLAQAQATNDRDEHEYSHGVFAQEPQAASPRKLQSSAVVQVIPDSLARVD